MTNFDQIRKWFSGKALTVLDAEVLPLLRQAEELGYWPKGASRRVKSGLLKQKVAEKFAREQERPYEQRRLDMDASGFLSDVRDHRNKLFSKSTVSGERLTHAMHFGLFPQAPDLLTSCDALAAVAIGTAEREALAYARGWCQDWVEVAALVKLLDSRRPPLCVRFRGTLSPLVARHLGEHLKLNLDTIRCPEFVGKWVKNESGDEVYQVEIIWPAGTLHGKSQFAGGSCNNQLCHACGHAIKNPFNWVPVAIDSTAGVPLSFWVGSDCAKKLFGVEAEGATLFVR